MRRQFIAQIARSALPLRGLLAQLFATLRTLLDVFRRRSVAADSAAQVRGCDWQSEGLAVYFASKDRVRLGKHHSI